jgi:hypothetical protein
LEDAEATTKSGSGYKFDLMGKYKILQEQGFDNHQIVKMIPDMRPIINVMNMPIHLQLSPVDGW